MQATLGLSRAVAPLAAVVSVTLGQGVWAQIPSGHTLIGQVERSVPDPAELAKYIRDKTAALKLGKALFWDMQVAAAIRLTSCATCPTFMPGGQPVEEPGQSRPAGHGQGHNLPDTAGRRFPNRQLTSGGLPASQADRSRRSCQRGPLRHQRCRLLPGGALRRLSGCRYGRRQEIVHVVPDPDGFEVRGVNVRRVSTRNTPTVIITVFDRILFWDDSGKGHFQNRDDHEVEVALHRGELAEPVAAEQERPHPCGRAGHVEAGEVRVRHAPDARPRTARRCGRWARSAPGRWSCRRGARRTTACASRCFLFRNQDSPS